MKLLKPALITAIAMFVWLNVSWMALPFHMNSMNMISDIKKADHHILEAIGKPAPEKSKVYFMAPCPEKMAEQKDLGPLPKVLIAYTPAGKTGNMTQAMVIEFALDFVFALLLSWILSLTVLTTFKDRFQLIAAITFVTIASGPVANWNWFGFSTSFTCAHLVDAVALAIITGFLIPKLLPTNTSTTV